jgi:hypothetical protein
VWGIAWNSMEWPRCQYPTHMVGQCWLYQYSQGFVGWPISSQHAHCFGRGIHLCHEHVQRIALRSDRNGSRSGDTWLFFHAPRRGYVLQLEMGDGSPFYGHFTGENEVSSILGCNGDLSELTSYEPVNFRVFCFRLWLLLRSFFTLVQSAGGQKKWPRQIPLRLRCCKRPKSIGF